MAPTIVSFFRWPKFPVLVEILGDLKVADSPQELATLADNAMIDASAILNLVDAIAKRWHFSIGHFSLMPSVHLRPMAKSQMLDLYRNSITGGRVGLPKPEKTLLTHSTPKLFALLVELLRRNL